MSSDLKTQFVNYMSLQRFSHHTKRSYLTGVKLLSKHYMQSPDTLSNDQIQDYIRYLLDMSGFRITDFLLIITIFLRSYRVRY